VPHFVPDVRGRKVVDESHDVPRDLFFLVRQVFYLLVVSHFATGLRASHVRGREMHLFHAVVVLGGPDEEVLLHRLDVEGLNYSVILLVIIVFLRKFAGVDVNGGRYLCYEHPRNAKRRQGRAVRLLDDLVVFLALSVLGLLAASAIIGGLVVFRLVIHQLAGLVDAPIVKRDGQEEGFALVVVAGRLELQPRENRVAVDEQFFFVALEADVHQVALGRLETVLSCLRDWVGSLGSSHVPFHCEDLCLLSSET